MNRIKYAVSLLLFCTFFLISLTGCTNNRQASAPLQPTELHVSAALGLKDALLEIQNNYEAQHPQTKIIFNLAASGSLQKQIEQGAPADVFISAAQQQLNALESKGLVQPESQRNLVGNKLVLVVPQNSSLNIADFKDLNSPMVKQFGMGAPETVPAGEYAKQVFTKLHIWDDVKGKAVLSKDVVTVLHYVETGNVDAGVIFSTVAMTSNKVKIVATAPEGSHDEIIFPGAILNVAKHPAEAADFLAYLTSPTAVKIFEKYGFSTIK